MRQHLQHMISLSSISKQWCSQSMLIGFRQVFDRITILKDIEMLMSGK